MTAPVVLLERPADGVALIRINRPESRNALNIEVRKLIAQYLTELGEDAATRCIVLTGNDKSFAAGADIKEMAGANTVDMMLRNTLKPLVAQEADLNDAPIRLGRRPETLSTREFAELSDFLSTVTGEHGHS